MNFGGSRRSRGGDRCSVSWTGPPRWKRLAWALTAGNTIFPSVSTRKTLLRKLPLSVVCRVGDMPDRRQQSGNPESGRRVLAETKQLFSCYQELLITYRQSWASPAGSLVETSLEGLGDLLFLSFEGVHRFLFTCLNWQLVCIGY